MVGLTNVVCQVGIAQQAVAAALRAPGPAADVAAATRTWQQRCEVILQQLDGYPCIRRTAAGRCSSTQFRWG